MLRFNGTVNGQKAWILLDSGASRNFVDTKFAQRNNMSIEISETLIIKLADEKKQETAKEVR